MTKALNGITEYLTDCFKNFISIKFWPDTFLSWLQNFGHRCWRPLERWRSGFDSCSSHTGKMIWKKIQNLNNLLLYFKMFSSHTRSIASIPPKSAFKNWKITAELGKQLNLLYSGSRLMWLLWARGNLIAITE